MGSCQVLWIVSIVGMLLPRDGSALRNVSLEVIPKAVQRGDTATLRCHYDLEGAPLYSVKWYRGSYEFYRYSPSEQPRTKIFAFNGIHVDLSQSNASQVVLRKVGFSLSGNFSCEVTTDAPSFSTAVVWSTMMVVVIPKIAPVIHTDKDRYDPGDMLMANCSSPPSKPAATLSFYLNNNKVGSSERKHQTPDLLIWSDVQLELLLYPSHYLGGRLLLRCVAEADNLYQHSAEVQLGPRVRDPIPERVTSPNATAHAVPTASLQMAVLVIISHIVR